MGIRARLIAAAMAAAAVMAAVAGVATASAAPATGTPISTGKEPATGTAPVEKAQRDGKPKPDKDQGVPEEAVKLLAAELRITVDRARQVFRDLEKVRSRGENTVKDPAFVAIAKGLGITPQQLLATLRKVKQEIGGKPKDKAPNGSPAK